MPETLDGSGDVISNLFGEISIHKDERHVRHRQNRKRHRKKNKSGAGKEHLPTGNEVIDESSGDVLENGLNSKVFQFSSQRHQSFVTADGNTTFIGPPLRHRVTHPAHIREQQPRLRVRRDNKVH